MTTSRMDPYATQERSSRLLLNETDSETMFAQNWAKVRGGLALVTTIMEVIPYV